MLRIFNQQEVEKTLNILDVMAAVEKAYLLNSQKEVVQFPTVVHFFPNDEGDMDIKSGCIDSENLMGMKMMTFMEGNIEQGLPPLMGCLMLFDRKTGQPLLLADAASVTNLRTGAAAGVGVKLLARADAQTMLLVGCGGQAAACAAAALVARPGIKKLLCCCRSLKKAEDFAAQLPQVLAQYLEAIPKEHPGYATAKAAFEVEVVGTTPQDGAPMADVILTVTTAHEPVIMRDWIKPGVHISCIGADMEGKQELDGKIMADARVFCDDIEKTGQFGEMASAIKAGLLSVEAIAGEIGEVIAGTKPGRTADSQLTVFDSSGISTQDILAAAMLLANKNGGTAVEF